MEQILIIIEPKVKAGLDSYGWCMLVLMMFYLIGASMVSPSQYSSSGYDLTATLYLVYNLYQIYSIFYHLSYLFMGSYKI